MATRALRTTNDTDVPIGKAELILRGDGGDISLLVANESLSVTSAHRAGGERVTELHVREHAEAFYSRR